MFEAALRDVDGLAGRDVAICRSRNPQVSVDLDRDQIAALGLTVDQVESALNSAYGSRQVSHDLRAERSVPGDHAGRAASSSAIPRRCRCSTCRRRGGTARAAVERVVDDAPDRRAAVGQPPGQLPSVTMSFNLKPGVALGDAVGARPAARAHETLPATVDRQLPGHGAGVPGLDAAAWAGFCCCAIFVIYVVLGILYESFIHPLTILSGLPSAGFGALLTLLLFHEDLNIYAFVGIIMLVGLVKKNGIMMIDFAIEARRDRRHQRRRTRSTRRASCASVRS